MLIRFLVSFLLIGMATSFSANAANGTDNGIKYSYAEFRFVDVDGGDGIEIGGSYRLDQQIYVIASLQDIDYGRVDGETLEIGGGFIIPNNKIDFAAEVAFLNLDVEGNSESGFSLAAGGRTFLTPELEVRFFAKHVDVVDSDTFIELGGDFFINQQVSVGATLEVASENDTLTVGGRYYF